MKITARVTGTADLARLDLTRLVQRLTPDLERQLQSSVPPQSPSPRLRGEGHGGAMPPA